MTALLVVGDPATVGLAVCRQLSAQGSLGTLAWHVTADLRDVADALADIGWDALLVDGDNEPLSTAAMSHLVQIHGVPDALVIGVDAAPLIEATLSVATMAARHLPEVTVALTGRQADQALDLWTPVATGLELDPQVVSPDRLPEALSHDQRHNTTERIA